MSSSTTDGLPHAQPALSSTMANPLSTACIRTLSDKAHEKRRAAATEIEKTAKELAAVNNRDQISHLIAVLTRDFVNSRSPHAKKGGLIGLASVAIGLRDMSRFFVDPLLRPIMVQLEDTDNNVRFYACESLYNVIKVCRDSVVSIFADLFVALALVYGDSEQNIRNGAEQIDRALKDIALSSTELNSAALVHELKCRLDTKDPFGRFFNLGWTKMMQNYSKCNFVECLPDFINALFEYLADEKADIHVNAERVLERFLGDVRADPSAVELNKMVNFLILHAQTNNVRVQLVAVYWIREFLDLGGAGSMMAHSAGILKAVLFSVANEQTEQRRLRELCRGVNMDVMRMINTAHAEAERTPSAVSEIPWQALIEVFVQMIRKGKRPAKLAIMRWWYLLFKINQPKMSCFVDDIVPELLRALADTSDEVVIVGVSVIAEICDPKYDNERNLFGSFVRNLLNYFKLEDSLRVNRAPFIIRQLCVLLDPEVLLRTFSELLMDFDDVVYKRRIVDMLNTIVMTTSELHSLRIRLKDMKTEQSRDLFTSLYKSWRVSPVAAIGLSFLSGCYRHAGDLIRIIGDDEINTEMLVELDRLVQLIESPLLAHIRMELLDSTRNADLLYALYGLLMFLPQCHAFHCLKDRLACLPPENVVKLNSSSTPRRSSSSSQRDKIDYASLLELFREAHSDYIKRTADTHASIVDAVALDLNAYKKNPSSLSAS